MIDERRTDAASRLWAHLQAIDGDAIERAVRAAKRGELFYQLRCLYSERESGGGRRSSGHGTFERECIVRGYKPRRVREWVRDHEVRIGLRPPADSTAAKQKARRGRSEEFRRGYQSAMNDFPSAAAGYSPTDSLSLFSSLLPFEALRAAYRKAASLLHPDCGGNSEQMQKLNDAWARVKKEYQQSDMNTRHYARAN